MIWAKINRRWKSFSKPSFVLSGQDSTRKTARICGYARTTDWATTDRSGALPSLLANRCYRQPATRSRRSINRPFTSFQRQIVPRFRPTLINKIGPQATFHGERIELANVTRQHCVLPFAQHLVAEQRSKEVHFGGFERNELAHIDENRIVHNQWGISLTRPEFQSIVISSRRQVMNPFQTDFFQDRHLTFPVCRPVVWAPRQGRNLCAVNQTTSHWWTSSQKLPSAWRS